MTGSSWCSRGRIVDEIPKAELGERRIIAAIIGEASTNRSQR